MTKPIKNPFMLKPENKDLYSNLGLDTNFKAMKTFLFKRADVVSELVPDEFPMDKIKFDSMHFIVMSAKVKIENLTLTKESDRLIIRYYIGNGEYLKIAVFAEKINGEDGFNYQFYKSDKNTKAFADAGQNIDVATNQIVQMAAVLIGLMVDNYSLVSKPISMKIRTKNSFKDAGDLTMYSRVNGTYIASAYPFFCDVDWEELKEEWESKFKLEDNE